MTKDQILAEAMALQPADRESLAEDLLLSLGHRDRAAIDAAWLEEVRRRDLDFAAGRDTESPIDDAIVRVLSRRGS